MDNTLNIKLYTNRFTANNVNLYVPINKDDIVCVTLNGVVGKYNNTKFYMCYFTFTLINGEKIDVEFGEAYKFKDLIKKFNLESKYNKYKNYIEEKETEK